MVRDIVTDPLFLSRKAFPATRADMDVAADLMDTLRANAGRCVGMAANMIGISKRIIVIWMDGVPVPMFNPAIVQYGGGTYEAEEGCLSHAGTKKTLRHRSVEVEYQDASFKKRRRHFEGFVAQVIQHEIDHCGGILI